MVSAPFGTTDENGELSSRGISQLALKRWSCDRSATFERMFINLEHF